MQSPRKLLAQAGIRPKKRYGQNFLVNASAAKGIARLALAGASAETLTIEIGAGTGTLTSALVAQGARLTALEIDPQLVHLLRQRADLQTSEIVQADALDFDYHKWAGTLPWRVAANLPYNVATPLILRLIEMPGGPESLTVMVQKDVAQRLIAAPATPAYGSLSVAVQYAMTARVELTLAPSSFFPPPKVYSSVVQLTRRAHAAASPRDPSVFWKVVRAAFAYRRKTLANSLALALGLDRTAIARAMVRSNLSPELRGERLDLGDFARLADALAEG